MVQENEAITLILGVVALAFLVSKRNEIRRMPEPAMLLLAFGMGFIAWTATVVEEVVFPNALNIIEHVSYAASSVFIAIWFWKSSRVRTKASGASRS